MPTLDEIRAKEPALSGLDDDHAVEYIRRAYYPDKSAADIASRLGVKPAAPEGSGTFRRLVGDTAVSAVKGAIGVPEAAVGLADLATGGRVGKFLENKDGAVGFRPKEANAALDDLYSPEQKAANAAVQAASDPNAQGFSGFMGNVASVGAAAIRNPSTIAHSVIQSLPVMGAGGVIGRGAVAGAQALSPAMRAAAAAPLVASPAAQSSLGAARIAAAGLGEGIVAAGQNAEQVRQETPDGLLTGEQALVMGASGAATGLLGAVSARVARSMGIGDIDVMLQGGGNVSKATQKGFIRKVLEGAFTEGVLEELPQSMQEQVAQNYALGKPLDEGLDQAAVMGTLAGGLMGGGAQVFHRQPEVGTLSRAANVAGGAAPVAPVAPTAPVAPVAPVAPPDPGMHERTKESLLAHANARAAALDEKAKGTKDETTPGPDGKPVVIPGKPPEFLTPAEKTELAFLKEAGGDVAALGRNYPDLTGALDEQHRAQDVAATAAPPAAPPAAPAAPAEPDGRPSPPPPEGFASPEPPAKGAPLVNFTTHTDDRGEFIRNKFGQPFMYRGQAAVALRLQDKPSEWKIDELPDGAGHELRRVASDVESTPGVAAEPGGSVGTQPGGSVGDRGTDGASTGRGTGDDAAAPVGRGPQVQPVADAGGASGSVAEQSTPPVAPTVAPEQSAKVEPTDILNPKGNPFGMKGPALAVQKQHPGGALVEVPGGWVVRPQVAADTKPAALPDGVIERIDGKDGMHVNIAKSTDKDGGFNVVLRDGDASETVSATVGVKTIEQAREKAREMLDEPKKAEPADQAATLPVDSAPAAEPGVVSAGEGAADTEQALTPLERKQPWAKNVLRIGGRAFEDGKPRVAPEGFTRLESKGWLAGWDDAANSKPTADTEQALTQGVKYRLRTMEGGKARYVFRAQDGQDGSIFVAPPGYRKGAKSWVITLDRVGGPVDDKGRTKFYPTTELGKFRTEAAAHEAAKQAIEKYGVPAAPSPTKATSEVAPGTGRDVMPAGLSVTFGGKSYPVDSITDAQEKWVAFRDSTGAGVSEVGNGVRVTDGAGRFVARISYNGRVWDGDGDNAKAIAEAPDRSAMPDGVRPDTAQHYLPPRETLEQVRARSRMAAPNAEWRLRQAMVNQSLYDENAIAYMEANINAAQDVLEWHGVEVTYDPPTGDARLWRNDDEITPGDLTPVQRVAFDHYMKAQKAYADAESGYPPDFFGEPTEPVSETGKGKPAARWDAMSHRERGDIIARAGVEGVRPSSPWNDIGQDKQARLAEALAAPAKAAPGPNTIFTDEAYQKARALLKSKLSGLNSGVDPEVLMAGITIAGHHIEKGARTFAAYAKAMIADLGDGIRPYLKSWYMGIKYDPRAAAFDGMDDAATVEKASVDAVEPANPATLPDSVAPSAGTDLTDHLYTAIFEGRMPKDNPALKKLVEAFDGKPATPERMKVAQESLEAAIVRVARDVVAKKEGPRSTFDALVRMYESQPLLNVRTSTSVANQAYSTPAPLAFVASELTGITQADTVFEPTGGTGMLLIGANPSKTHANEKEPTRQGFLLDQGFDVTRRDATEPGVAKPRSKTRVIMNPPFGPIKNAAGESIKVKVDGYTLGQIDHLIAARSLEAMKDDGSATLIIGANKVAGEQSNNDLIFFNWLYGNYNVTSHFEVDGDLYERQGAGWPVRVITIEGRNRSSTTAPAPGTIKRAMNWGEVYERFQQSMDAQRAAAGSGAGPVSARSGPTDDAIPVSGIAGGKTGRADSGRPEGGAPGDGNVTGKRTGPVVDSGVQPDQGVGERTGAQRPDDGAPVAEPAVRGPSGAAERAKPAGDSGTSSLASAENQFQTAYVARSARKDDGILIPVNMAQPTQDALDRLEDEVGNIDEFARKELGYDSIEALHEAFMGLQIDAIASAIQQIKNGKGIIIADQTGIGKGRQAAAIIRWANKAGHIPVFVSVKPSLFTDMYGDLHDIGTDDIAPFILNVKESIKGVGDEKLFANRATGHRKTIDDIGATGTLPKGRNALFMTYSQINVQNPQRAAVLALAPNAVFILDESHNAAGDSATGDFIKSSLDMAKGVTYLSATYAKRPDNMPVYFKTDIGDAVADDATLMSAMEAGGLPLQTVVSNNLVKAGQMFRRERSYDGISIESRADTAHRAEHVRLSDDTTSALRAIVAADRTFHEGYVKSLQKELAKQGERIRDIAGNQAQQSVDHTEFSSIVHNFVRQMLLGLKAQEAADDAIRSLARGEKPLIAVENTMGTFLAEYAATNNLKVGDPLGNFSYRTVLSRALERSRYIVRQLPNGDKVREQIPMSALDPESFIAYTKAQKVIDGLDIDIPVSPIDWMRSQITKAGHSVAEITGRHLTVDYTDPANPILAELDSREHTDKVRTTRMFNDGSLDALVLNVAGSTGISLHASEKFKDQRQRHMIVAQAAQDINIFMQMLGRINRTGQINLPKYTILSADLPAEVRPTAILSAKMKGLNANTSSNTESATSVKSVDMLNKYGDDVINTYLNENPELQQALNLPHGETPDEDFARKATGRIALMPVATQAAFYADVEGQYNSLIDYLNQTNQNELEPRDFDFDAQETRAETLFEGQNKASPFGEDATYGEYSVKAQGKALTPEEIQALIDKHLDGKTGAQHAVELLAPLNERAKTFEDGLERDEHKNAAAVTRETGRGFIMTHPIGSRFRVDINGDHYNAIVTNLRSTHKASGNPFSLSKIQVTIAVNGSLRSVTVPATKFRTIETSRIGRYDGSNERLFKVGPPNERETAKIVTGNLLGAYGEMQGTRGSIITFSRADGTTEQGILLPKSFNFTKDVRQDYRLKTSGNVFDFLTKSTNENIDRFGINSRDSVVRVLPNGHGGIIIQVPKSKAKGGKYFLDAKLLAATGDFTSVGSFMRARIEGRDASIRALDVLMQKQALYALPSMAAEARTILEDEKPAPDRPALSRTPDGTIYPERRADEVQEVANKIAARWQNAPPIVVVRTIDDPKIPDAVRAEGQKSVAGTPNGFFHDGKVYLIANKLGTEADIVRVLMHESLGHFGMRATFGAEFGAMLDRMAVLNSGKVRAAATKYGFDFDKQSERRMAAEEVLAYMAQNAPELGWVKRAIAAIRSWARANIPGFSRLKLSDSELIRDFILPARRYVESGPRGDGPKGGGEHVAFSRTLTEAITSGLNSARAVNLPANYKVADLMKGAGQLHWWHKSVGMMYHLAQKSPPFKRVFDTVQQFLRDATYYSAEAAELAPNVLPKLDKLADAMPRLTIFGKQVGKSALSADDTKAVSAPVFQGTLTWARDEHGVARPLDELEEEMGAVELDDKAHKLMRAGHIAPEILRMWQGLPMEQYEKIIEGKFEKEFLKPGVVFTPAELRQHFGLNDAQIGHYQEVRAALDKSLDHLTISEMLNYAGADVATLREQVLDMHDPAEVAVLLRDHLFELAKTEPARAEALNDAGNKMIAIDDHRKDMQARGYAPLSRFGNYTLEATLPTGERYFSMFDTDRERNRMQRILTEKGATEIEAGTMSQEAYKLLNGISPETAALFGEMLGLDDQGSEEANLAYQTYLKKAIANRSAMKRLLKRQGIAGYSEDVGRVLAAFVVSNGRKTSSNIHQKELSKAVESIPKTQGELKDAAVKLREYVRNPQEEAQGFRALLFAQYIGGSIASAMINATQPLMMSFPYLSQFGGVKNAASKLVAAAKAAASSDPTGDAALDAALKRAEEEGTVSPQEIHSLQAQAMGRAHLKAGDGTKAGDAAATASNLISKVSLAWGKVFGVAEQFNRRVTFIAAYRIAVENGIAHPEAFAKKAVDETQGVYNCVDADTECLTLDGWKRHEQIGIGDVVYAIDKKGGLVESSIVDMHRYSGAIPATEFRNSNGFSMVVTDQHDMLIRSHNSRDRKYGTIRRARPDEVKAGHHFLRVPLHDATNRAADYTDDEVALFAWVAAEGHLFAHRNVAVKRGVSIVQSQRHNPQYVAEIDALLDRLGGHYNRKIARGGEMVCWQLRKPLWIKVHEALPGKMLTHELVRKLTPAQMALFVETFAKGDGHIAEEGGATITQKDVGNLSALQAMAVLSGQSSTLYERVGRHEFGSLYVAKNSKHAHSRPMARTRLEVPFVWCPQTEHGTWIARRNGRTFVTGNSGNKPRWARGAVGSILFTFKQYSVNYVELLHRMATAGEPGSEERKVGQKAALLALAVLFLMAGADGLPFAEDAQDVVDAAMQRLGYNFSSKQKMREFFAGVLGEGGAEFVTSGASGLPGMPIDFSGRTSLGNMIPGTGLFQKKSDHTRDLMEFAGAAGDLVKRGFGAAESVIDGDVTKGAIAIMPNAVRNVVKAADMAHTGMYRDDRGRKVVDTNLAEAAAKAIGFQPRSAAQIGQAGYEAESMKAAYRLASSEINEKWARAKFDDDADLLQEAKDDVARWNRNNPEQRITPNMPAILKRVREMRKPKEQRIADTAPKAIRASVRQQLAEAKS